MNAGHTHLAVAMLSRKRKKIGYVRFDIHVALTHSYNECAAHTMYNLCFGCNARKVAWARETRT